MREVDIMAELLIGVVAAVAFIPMTFTCYNSITKNPYGAYDSYVDKSALETDAETINTKFALSKDDVMLSLLISDRYTPQPKFIKVTDGYAFQLGASSHFKLVDNFKLSNDEPLSIIDAKKIEKCWYKYKDEVPVKASANQQWKLKVSDDGTKYWSIEDKE